MKKLIIKTALITLGVALILAVSIFGIVSFVAPAAMMRFCDSIGLDSLSGDYAYQQYHLSGEIDYLARSFEIAASIEKDAVAATRFEELYGEAGSDQRSAFYEYCSMQNAQGTSSLPEEVSGYDYRLVICAKAAVVRYRLAQTEEDFLALCDFVIEETDSEFTVDCPVAVLAAESAFKSDTYFCALLRFRLLQENKFNTKNTHYINILKILEDATHE